MKTLFLFAFIACLIFSCNHKRHQSKDTECTKLNTTYLPVDAKARFSFLHGTWWVYKSNTNLKDSVYSIATSNILVRAYVKNEGATDKCHENGYTSIQSSVRGYLNTGLVNHYTDSENYADQTFAIQESNGTNFTVYRFELKGNTYLTNQEGGIVTFEDSVVTSYDTLYNALHLSYPTTSHLDYIQDGWYVKNIGLVKYIHKDGTIWELYNYHIKQ